MCTVDHRLMLGINKDFICAVADLTGIIEHCADFLTGKGCTLSPQLVEACDMQRTTASAKTCGQQTEVIVKHDRIGLVRCNHGKCMFDIITEALVIRADHADSIAAVDAGIGLIRIHFRQHPTVSDACLHQNTASKSHFRKAVAEQVIFFAQNSNLINGRISFRNECHHKQGAGCRAVFILVFDIFADFLQMIGIKRHDGIVVKLHFGISPLSCRFLIIYGIIYNEKNQELFLCKPLPFLKICDILKPK